MFPLSLGAFLLFLLAFRLWTSPSGEDDSEYEGNPDGIRPGTGEEFCKQFHPEAKQVDGYVEHSFFACRMCSECGRVFLYWSIWRLRLFRLVCGWRRTIRIVTKGDK